MSDVVNHDSAQGASLPTNWARNRHFGGYCTTAFVCWVNAPGRSGNGSDIRYVKTDTGIASYHH